MDLEEIDFEGLTWLRISRNGGLL